MDIKMGLIKKSPTKPVPEQKFNTSVSKDTDRKEVYSKKEPVKIKPLDCPTWDGRFRTFARFKLLWSENITPRICSPLYALSISSQAYIGQYFYSNKYS